MQQVRPYPELSVPGVLLGTVQGVVMTASFVYIALKVGFGLGGSTVAAILGFGKASDDLGIIDATVFELGGQFTYYLVGDFDHGMQLGAEVLFVYLSDDNAVQGGVFGGGLSDSGFQTGDAQVRIVNEGDDLAFAECDAVSGFERNGSGSGRFDPAGEVADFFI